MTTAKKPGGGHAARTAARKAQRAARPPAGVSLVDSRTRARDGTIRVEMWPLSRLVQYERNPRRNDDSVDRMAAAITEFGFRIPIVAKSDGTIVDGHLRYKAARKLRLTEVPVALADGLSDAQVQAFRLLANRSANWASFDDDLLRLELGELRDAGFDLSLSGFELGELATLLGEPAAPEPESKARTGKTVMCPGCGLQFPAA